MRLILVLLPISIMVVVLSIASVMSGSFAGGGLSGGGPVAVAAVAFMALLAVAFGYIFVTVALPILVVMGMTIVCAMLAGYRIFRWLRWIGILSNVAGLAYFIWLSLSSNSEKSLPWFIYMFYGLFVANALLFYFMPRRPNTALSFRVITPMHFICWAILPCLYALAVIDGAGGNLVFMSLMLLIYMVPFYFNHRATRLLVTGEVFGPALKILLYTALATALLSALSPPLGMPMMLSCLLLLGLLEMKYLYPEVEPTTGDLRRVLVRTLGRLPD